MPTPPRPTGAPAFVALPGYRRDQLVELLVASKPGTARADVWETSRRTALRKLRNRGQALTEDAAVRLDFLFRTGRRSSLADLLPGAYALQLTHVQAYLEDVLDELAAYTPTTRSAAA